VAAPAVTGFSPLTADFAARSRSAWLAFRAVLLPLLSGNRSRNLGV
jgi:hypothetical protein